jgi:predicted nucleic acid-binding protein
VTPEKVIVDTDVILDHLLADASGETVLRKLMRTYFCYTTVVNAAALFALASSTRQRTAIEHALGAVKILGINARSAKQFGNLLRTYPRLGVVDSFLAGICLESRLPLCTFAPQRFSAVRKLRVLPAHSL